MNIFRKIWTIWDKARDAMAPRGKTTQLDHMYVADFETCDAVANSDDEKCDQRVWLAGHKNLSSMKSTYFYNLDDFMTDILARKDNSNVEIAFHNLKFDGSYIVPWLLRNGYESTQSKPHANEFSVLVDDRNNWYSITVQINSRKKVTIWDSYKLFPCALEYLPDVYSTPTRKLREDAEFYERHRGTDHVPDSDEMAYFENDLQVPAEALNRHIELYGLRFKKTQASQSFYNFEQSFKAWKFRFPPLTTEQDQAVRPAYWGGISYVPPHKASKDWMDVTSMDINSSYPHKAAECKLPYGECVEEHGEDKHPNMSKFWVAEALVEFKLKKNHLPCIPSKAIIEGRPLEVEKWVDDSKGIVRMTFCSIDYGTMLQSYDITVHRWIWSMHWPWKRHREVAAFVYRNNDIKVKHSQLAKEEQAKGEACDPHQVAYHMTMRNRAKIDNNGFYGKFGEEIIKEGKTPYVDGDGNVYWAVDRHEEQNERTRKFLPVAIAITAWGRRQLVEMANILGEDFLYCDTDSVHFLQRAKDKLDKAVKKGEIELDGDKLGAWDHEGDYTRGRYLRAKCYMEETKDGKLLSTVAGLPPDKHTGQFSKQRSCLNWDNFYIGHLVPEEQSNKLRTVQTRTGYKLVPTHFRIKQKETLF